MARKSNQDVEQSAPDEAEAEDLGDPLDAAVGALSAIEAEREEAAEVLGDQEADASGSEHQIEDAGEGAEAEPAPEVVEAEEKPVFHHYMAGVPDGDLNDDGTFKPGLQDWHEQWNRGYPGYTGPRDPNEIEAPDKPSGEVPQIQTEEE